MSEKPTTQTLFGPDDRIVLFDAECGLCTRSIQFIIRHDPNARLQMLPSRSELGQEVLESIGRTETSQRTIVFIENNQVYTRSTAVLRMYAYLEFPYWLLSWWLVVPRFIRDFCYNRIANNRHRLFPLKSCWVPTPEITRHFFRGTVG